MRTLCIAAWIALAAAALQPCPAQQRPGKVLNLAPFVPSPQPIVDLMLEASGLKPGEMLYDLGCGDGRILITAAQKFHARAVGVEISGKQAQAAEDAVKRLGLEEQIRVLRGNLLDVDLSPADVVTLYLLTGSNEQLRPNLERYLKAGARVVSHDFEVRGWEPVRVERAEIHHRAHRVYVYEMPPRKR